MLRLWKAFVLDKEKPAFPPIEENVADEDIKCDGKYGAIPVSTIETIKPRVIFVGGITSLTSGDLRPNQVLKIYSYLSAGGIKPNDIDLYIPIYGEPTDPKVADAHRTAYKLDPLHYTSLDGKRLSESIFPDEYIKDLTQLSTAERSEAVRSLQLLASQTTFIGFSFGPTLIEDAFNNFTNRMEKKGWRSDEIKTVISALLSYHAAPVNPVADKRYNLPQVNNWALNDKTARQNSNFESAKYFDLKQHPILLDAMPFPDTLLLATTTIPGHYNTFSLTSHLPNERAKQYATVLPLDEAGNPRYDVPVGKNYLRPSPKSYPERHAFDLYTGITRIIREEYSDPRQTSFVINIFGTNPMAEPFLHSVSKGIHASIESKANSIPRNSRAILKDTKDALTPKAKDRYVINTTRDIIEERMLGEYAERYNAFADRLLTDFPDWSRPKIKARDEFLARFDEKANKVLNGEEQLGSFLKWSNKYTERSGRLPGD